MNQYAPADWTSSMGDAFATLGGGGDDGLIELLWCNGHVVMQTQAPPRKPPATTRPTDHKPAAAAQQDDEAAAAAAWFQYPAVEDPLDRDLFAELFGETAAREDDEGETKASARQARLMPPPPRPAKARGALGSGRRLGGGGDGGWRLVHAHHRLQLLREQPRAAPRALRAAASDPDDGAECEREREGRRGARSGHRDLVVDAAQVLHHAQRPARPRQAEAERRRRGGGGRGPGVRIRRRRHARAGAEALHGQAPPRRRGPQPLGTETEGQDQREDEGAAGAHCKSYG